MDERSVRSPRKPDFTVDTLETILGIQFGNKGNEFIPIQDLTDIIPAWLKNSWATSFEVVLKTEVAIQFMDQKKYIFEYHMLATGYVTYNEPRIEIITAMGPLGGVRVVSSKALIDMNRHPGYPEQVRVLSEGDLVILEARGPQAVLLYQTVITEDKHSLRLLDSRMRYGEDKHLSNKEAVEPA